MRRAGYTLAEALVALVLLTVLLQVAWGVAAVHTRAAHRLFDRAEMVELARAAGWVLRNELRAGVEGEDWLPGDDSVSLRAFRALGIVCPSLSSEDGLVVRVEGIREADPSKDSALVLWPDGRWRAHALLGRSAGPACGGEETTERWRLDPPEAGGYLVRLYERGSYHVVDGALRYRRGLSGRQPLTPRSLGAASGLEFGEDSGVLTLEPARGLAPGWRVRQRLWARHGAR